MRKSASEIIRNLEMRVARLEKQSANIKLFDILWNNREKTKKHTGPSFSHGTSNGERYLSASAEDMEIFLERNGFTIDRFKDASRNEMLYIMENNHKAKRDQWYVFVVRERMVKYRWDKRTGWKIGHKKYG